MLARHAWLLLLAILLIFGIGVAELFTLRFSRGDIYPPYSSLRADPLGSKALHDALVAVEGFTVSRNQSPLQFLETERNSTLIYIGVPARYLAYDSELSALGKLAAEGHRVVIGLLPTAELPKPEPEPKPPGAKKEEKITPIDLAPRLWQIDLVQLPKKIPVPLEMTGLDQPISYHSGLGFAPRNDAWKTLASVGSTPVIVERRYGGGSLVLLADSYLFSNEALRSERRPQLLSALLGSNRNFLFDETHFGVQEQPGVATLARRYRLHGVVLVSLLLAMLFLWKNLTPLFPRIPAGDREVVLSGQTAHSGLINLLQRSVPLGSLPEVCLAEWKKTSPTNFRPEAIAEAARIAAETKAPTLERLARMNDLLNPQKNVTRPH